MMHLLTILAVVTAQATGLSPSEAGPSRADFTVKPAATGRQLVRLSLSLARGILRQAEHLVITSRGQKVAAAVRVLTWHSSAEHEPRAARRAMVTFPWTFSGYEPVFFRAETTPGAAPLTPRLEAPHEEQVEPRVWDELYETGPPLDLAGQPDLASLLNYHDDAIVRSAARGDDWGNVTQYTDGKDAGLPFGMNWLNHCAAIFEEACRSGDRRRRQAAVNWCDNFHGLSIWWGLERQGGTRYNNLLAMGRTPLDDDRHFMWRSNESVDFCTKGYRSFLLAYEETGDPRHREALAAQLAYARQFVHADRGEARNIGDVDDFVRLYRDTGDIRHRDEALRLFRELRTKLSAGDLFDQGGRPIKVAAAIPLRSPILTKPDRPLYCRRRPDWD
jgi:hypothetical protein